MVCPDALAVPVCRRCVSDAWKVVRNVSGNVSSDSGAPDMVSAGQNHQNLVKIHQNLLKSGFGRSKRLKIQNLDI